MSMATRGSRASTRAIALVDVLQRAGWVKRALFLADRMSLVNQAVSAFKAHLPESSPVNLVTEKKEEGRVYVSTYPTMMGLIDQTKGEELRFGVGHFDLVVIDEAHRSVYQKYGAIFRYFDSLLVGLTATPRDEVDKNTYDLFDLTALRMQLALAENGLEALERQRQRVIEIAMALEQEDERYWALYFCTIPLGILDARKMKILDRRRRVWKKFHPTN